MAEQEEQSGIKRQPFSFQIKKKVDNKPLIENSGDSKASKDYVLFLEDKEITSTEQKEEKKELVVPLIKNNVWRLPHIKKAKEGKQQNEESTKEAKTITSLDEIAIKELVSEALQETTNTKGKNHDDSVIPLVMQNQIPEGYETDDKMDVSLRPDEPTLEDYEQIPIEEYGFAVLRGMGWKPGAPIGGVNKQCVQPVEVKLRPRGLGLGADRKLLEQAKKHSNTVDKDNEDLQLANGCYVRLKQGQNKGLYGQVEGLDQENARILVKLALGNKVISVSEFVVQVVSKKEYNKEAKCINRDKYQELKNKQYKEEEYRKHKRENQSEEESSNSVDSRKRHHKEEKHDRSRKHRHKEKGDGGHSDESDRRSSWVKPQLRVRFIDREFKKGKYFNSKLVVEEVSSSDQIACRTEEGKRLDSVRTSMLETVIPRKEPLIVMVVQGHYTGHLGKIMERDKTKCIAAVQLFSRKKKIVELEYDSICEFVGQTFHQE